MKRSATIAAVFAVTVSLAPAPSRAATVPVFMTNLMFCNTPVCLDNEDTTIKKGDTVEWVYADASCTALAAIGCKHTVTSFGSPSFPSSGFIPSGTPPTTLTYRNTFAANGIYSYVCANHSTMTAKIKVTTTGT